MYLWRYIFSCSFSFHWNKRRSHHHSSSVVQVADCPARFCPSNPGRRCLKGQRSPHQISDGLGTSSTSFTPRADRNNNNNQKNRKKYSLVWDDTDGIPDSPPGSNQVTEDHPCWYFSLVHSMTSATQPWQQRSTFPLLPILYRLIFVYGVMLNITQGNRSRQQFSNMYKQKNSDPISHIICLYFLLPSLHAANALLYWMSLSVTNIN